MVDVELRYDTINANLEAFSRTGCGFGVRNLMSDLRAYFTATANRETAYERYNYASAALENAKIKERLAEIKSQHEPLASLLNQPLSERDRLYATAFYVVIGRMPDGSGNVACPQGVESTTA